MVAGITPRGWAVLLTVAAGGGVGAVLARVAWQQRADVPAARIYAALVGVAGAWCLAYLGVLLSPPPLARGLFNPLVVLFSGLTPFLWLAFVVRYTGRGEWLTRRTLGLLFAEPLAYAALYASNPLHGLLFDRLASHQWQGLTLLGPGLTTPVLVQIGVAYAVSFVGFGLLLSFVVGTRNVHRRQAATILVGALVTMVGNVLFVAGASPHPALDVTPVFFVANGAVIGWALFRYDFLSVTPLGRDRLVEAMDDPVVVLDEADALLEYNAAAAAQLGVDDEDLGRSADDCLPGLLAALDADGPVSLRTADGGDAVYDPRPTALTDQHGFERARLVVLRDVTLLKRREGTLVALQSATRELMNADDEEAVAAVVVATAADVLDHEFAGYLAHDPERERLASTTLTPQVASKLPDGELVYGPDDGLVWEAFREGETVVEEDLAGECEPLLDDVPLSSVVLLPVGDHGLFGVGSVDRRRYSDDDLRFLTTLGSAAESALDRLDRERELREHRDALEEQNERLGEFASIVSHDLRTPLTTATGYLSLARDEVDDPDVDGYLGRVADSHARMDGLIEDVLALAQQGQVVDEPEVVPLREVALSAWQTAGHVDASFDLRDPPETVLADRERVRTLFENLLGNAVDHVGTDVTVTVGGLDPASADGGVTAEGTQAGGADPDAGADRADAGTTGFYVADDGPGIPAEERDDVFEQGYSGDTGTGLGLAIVDRIAEAHGWTVTITESEDGGARFEFTGVERAE